MPIYEYECEKCAFRFDLTRRFDEDAGTLCCPQCRGKVRRLYFPSAILYKGSGFYVTDNQSNRNGPSEEGKTDKVEGGKKKQGKVDKVEDGKKDDVKADKVDGGKKEELKPDNIENSKKEEGKAGEVEGRKKSESK